MTEEQTQAMDAAHFPHGGDLIQLAKLSGFSPEQILDFSSNINPLGPPEWLRPVVSLALERVAHYPDPHSTRLVAAVAQRYGVSADEVLVGNGSTEILHLVPRAAKLRRAVIPVPCYLDYLSVASNAGMKVKTLFMREEEGFALDPRRLSWLLQGRDLVFLGVPNNPTGLLVDGSCIRDLAAAHPSCLFVVDEAFGDFVVGMDSLTKARPENVLVLLSLTKIFAIPGLRLGCAVGEPTLVEQVKRIQPPWSVNVLAQAVGEAALKDISYVERSRRCVTELRGELAESLGAIPGLSVYPGKANFLLVRVERSDLDARCIFRGLLERGIAVRVCENFPGLDARFFRVAVRGRKENQSLCRALRDLLGIAPTHRPRRRTSAVMFQGTSSNAGKSVLTTALCRILLQEGYRVAPFKAQNMSLNSFVTASGGEMGRAQVVQAQACRLEPDVRMNPVLLKPNSETGSQVIVLGRPVGNMQVEDYLIYKPNAFEAARQAYDSLAEENEVMVLEGAGSPAEINLKKHDFVNMPMARYANAKVLLVGDIDRGGVFASFVGTMEVLEQWERALIAGFVVNRFRGKEWLLASGLEYMFRHTGKPVLGIVPFFKELGLPEEDSVSFKERLPECQANSEERIEVALIDLPHISNFTDFDALRGEPDVSLKIVRSPADLGRPDAIILPGSKNVMGDMEHLRASGIHHKIMELVGRGRTELVGICGGFQMLGKRIRDPHGLESGSQDIEGLGYLPVTTVLAPEKTLKRVKATHLASGLEVRGYEIHHGQSLASGLEPVLRLEDGGWEGARWPKGRIWGTYMHGIFDADEFRRWFVDRLRSCRGLPPLGRVCFHYELEPALDRLAEAVRRCLKVEEIFRAMGLR